MLAQHFGSDGCTVTGCTLNGHHAPPNANCLSGFAENNICNEYCLANEKASSNKCMACEAGKTTMLGCCYRGLAVRYSTLHCQSESGKQCMQKIVQKDPRETQGTMPQERTHPVLQFSAKRMSMSWITPAACVSGFRLAGDNALQRATQAAWQIL